MRHNKKLIISLVFIIVLAALSFAFMSGCSKADPAPESQQEAVVPTPLVLETPKEQIGSISCYDRDSGELIQQYEGPITVTRRNGQYVVHYETSSCTCFSCEEDIEE